MPFGSFGFPELLLFFLLVLLLFGAKRIPEVGRSLGKGIREFKSATKELRKSVDEVEEEEKPSPSQKERDGEPVERKSDRGEK
ncbi:MAG: twin-arginine translocase TatA/TatE family subunit [Gemmatimonadetes bacterium]|nr:twin-arginine translocase TatA/TatE family subunit [Gemmatimonadota bacterium]